MAKINPLVSRILTLIPLISLPLSTMALTIVECEDKSGASTFAERCPPGSTKKGEKQLRGLPIKKDDRVSVDEIAREHPITLFAVENCDACDLVRNQLLARDIPFTEIDVANDQEKFDLLTAATGGAATVPTLTIDDKVLTGHNSASLDSALNDAGYP
ncbi:MAG: glutaredoxin family protein [Gammaproteobacteria bacterium]